MEYTDALSYLYAACPAFSVVGNSAFQPGFERVEPLLALMDNPHLKWPAVHVAGTNGKGSTCHLIAASLQSAGLKVGLFTSPHLVDFRERIRVNGQMIPQQELITFVETYRSDIERIQPSFFEVTMALAFEYFAQSQVDIAVIEVGLGGRLDSTNILPPNHSAFSNSPTGEQSAIYGVLLSVITNIGMDHMALLGNTLSEIATEKAGIIRPDVPCVIGETHEQTAPIFIERARACRLWGHGLETSDCRIWFADQCGYLQRCRLRDVPQCELHGNYQEKNMQTAYVALRALMASGQVPKLTIAAIRQGFASVCTLTGLQGRWQVLRERPLTICDTGHNSHGLRYVSEQLAQLKYERLHMVFGMVSDKDVESVLPLLPKDAIYYFTQADSPRAIAAADFAAMAAGFGLHGTAYPSIEDAVQAAQRAAAADDVLFIGGSNYIVGVALTCSM